MPNAKKNLMFVVMRWLRIDAYRQLASSIHETRQARLVHFKQQKFSSLDLRSRNAQREKECYVRSFQCWARTQTRTAH